VRKRPKLVLAVVAAGVVAVVGTQVLPAGAHGRRATRARLLSVEGLPSGTVRFTQLPNRVRIQVRATNLAAGFHGFHLHTVGTCEGNFTSAGGHFNPTGTHHGGHAGDLPNVLSIHNVGVNASYETDRFTVNQLFDGDGTAVVVHDLPDNHANIPARYAPNGPDEATLATGDSGGRHLCGVIRR
jgi:Cu-Zn family superoxide dismutase